MHDQPSEAAAECIADITTNRTNTGHRQPPRGQSGKADRNHLTPCHKETEKLICFLKGKRACRRTCQQNGLSRETGSRRGKQPKPKVRRGRRDFPGVVAGEAAGKERFWTQSKGKNTGRVI